ncbi:MAG: ATP-dependent DNA helicase [Gammaproteobacteria bacterium]
MFDFSGLLGTSGAFSEILSGFTPRNAQQILAGAIGRALAQQDILVAEAGTGTGKTFAYLIPALLSGKRILISTGTRTLQDQLYHRDLPVVRQVLGMPVKMALLKGRSNYLCRHRLGIALHHGAGLFDKCEQAEELGRVSDWANSTRSGEISELGTVPESSLLWPQVTSTVENCLGQECPEYGSCFLLEARRSAQEADIVVINHHLLMADMLLKEEGFGALLPGVDAIIVDEAHQLPDIASQHFSISFSSHRLHELIRDSRREYREAAADSPEIVNILEMTESSLGKLQQRFSKLEMRTEWQALQSQTAFQSSLHALDITLTTLQQALQILAERSGGLKNCWQRVNALAARLSLFAEEGQAELYVRWIERFGNGFSLNLTPLDAAGRFQSCMRELGCGWIFLSATLSINGGFEHFRERLGLTNTEELLLGSPFDYEHNALLYLPTDLPDVNTPAYTAAVVQAVLPVIRASGGRAFLLFTSHRALREAADLVRNQFEFPLLVQGEAPRRRLLERFRELGNAVLLGTTSFWEGVDVKGPALSVVMIDRLPFASPGDPIIKARLTALKHAGREPFMDYQLPQAVLALKQGVGRLIRDDTDRGVMMLCDPRITRRGYGKLFLESLPPMCRTRSLEDVQNFLAEILPINPKHVTQ